jgi:hypothetical protein
MQAVALQGTTWRYMLVSTTVRTSDAANRLRTVSSNERDNVQAPPRPEACEHLLASAGFRSDSDETAASCRVSEEFSWSGPFPHWLIIS